MDEDEHGVMLVDEGVHTADSPYCGDLGCWCHTDVGYHDVVMSLVFLDEDVEQAYSFYGIAR